MKSKKVIEFTLSLPNKLYSDVLSLSKEHMRTLEQEMVYRLDQGVRMRKHLSEHDTGLLKLISGIYLDDEMKNQKGEMNEK